MLVEMSCGGIWCIVRMACNQRHGSLSWKVSFVVSLCIFIVAGFCSFRCCIVISRSAYVCRFYFSMCTRIFETLLCVPLQLCGATVLQLCMCAVCSGMLGLRHTQCRTQRCRCSAQHAVNQSGPLTHSASCESLLAYIIEG